MNKMAPCKGCADRHTACHGKCEAYQEWRDEYHAQKKYLEDTKDRMYVPMTESRSRAYKHFYDHRSHDIRYKGGSQ